MNIEFKLLQANLREVSNVEDVLQSLIEDVKELRGSLESLVDAKVSEEQQEKLLSILGLVHDLQDTYNKSEGKLLYALSLKLIEEPDTTNKFKVVDFPGKPKDDNPR